MATITCAKQIKVLFKADSGTVYALYETDRPFFDGSGRPSTRFRAKGCVPEDKVLTYSLTGDWTKYKDDWQLSVTSYKEELPSDEAGMIRFLKTLGGLGEKRAGQIVSKFGAGTFKVLDTDMEQLASCGIPKKTRLKIQEQWIRLGNSRELYMYLKKYVVADDKIKAIGNAFGATALDVVKAEPYELFWKFGISFAVSDKIAKDEGFSVTSKARVQAIIGEVLHESEIGAGIFQRDGGHLLVRWNVLLPKVYEYLYGDLEKGDARKRLYSTLAGLVNELAKERKIFIAPGERSPAVYRAKPYEDERKTALKIAELTNGFAREIKNPDKKIYTISKSVGILLSPEQQDAVKTALSHPLSIITGGPGTGKTTILQMVTQVYTADKPNASIVLCAPTGRAARRMTDAIGLPANTIHSTLQLAPSDEQQYIPKSLLESEDLIIVDEASMLDMSIAKILFDQIGQGTSVVFVGDTNQLPSINAGNVLGDMIASGKIPTVNLKKIYRQKTGSSIAVNAARIKRGNTDLEIDDSFSFDEAEDSEQIAGRTAEIYKELVAAYGIDEVAVLTPFRKNTITAADGLNPVLREAAGITAGKSVSVMGTLMYEGDKIMYTKNEEGLANGDSGFIRRIAGSGNNITVTCEFSSGLCEFDKHEMSACILAYASTVHKSQGSEYKAIIFVCDPAHKIMLMKNLVYTGITRAKEKAVVVGSRKTFNDAIGLGEKIRNTRLSELIISDCEMYSEIKSEHIKPIK
jgi:exodeoxyribonuclease V alpha subunit